MNINTPQFTVRIEDLAFLSDLSSEISSFVFEDTESGIDLCEVRLLNRWQALTDHPLLQEGNILTCRWGYIGNLSQARYMVLREIDYDFPEDGIPSITLRAFDAGIALNDKDKTKVWTRDPAGIRYCEIVAEIAAGAPGGGLATAIHNDPEKDVPRMRVPQDGISDLKFLMRLADELGWQCFVEDRMLHFHPAALADPPTHLLVYGLTQDSMLRSFRPASKEEPGGTTAQSVEIVGVDPKTKAVVSVQSSNEAPTVRNRISLGQKTNLSGADSKVILPSPDPLQQQADAYFKAAEMRQIEANAMTIGDPTLAAKTNVEIQGVGRKFGGVYHVTTARHSIDDTGYSCELTLRRNAVTDAGAKAEQTTGQPNEGSRSDNNTAPPPQDHDSNTGDRS